MSVCVKPGPHTHTKHDLRFPPQYHTYYRQVIVQPFYIINVLSRCCVQQEHQ
jgi:hypothetical protein